ncbi:hypothetical protein R1flu_016805 [Riccia fluitans]|uniref:Uncharacterized protein n=1 Tax=Riccia fluitans TaxID=41844 RepID=A0ABD1YMW4_9MARC
MLEKRMVSSPVITLEEYNKICLEVDPEEPCFNSLQQGPQRRTEVWSPQSDGIRDLIANGFVNRDGLRTVLKHSLQLLELSGKILDSHWESSMTIDPDWLIDLLLALEVCYKDEDRGGYLIPAALDDEEEMATKGIGQLKWTPIDTDQSVHDKFFRYVGRRLECEGENLTMLRPGFFPRLQVVLRKRLLEKQVIKQKGDPYFKGNQGVTLVEAAYDLRDPSTMVCWKAVSGHADLETPGYELAIDAIEGEGFYSHSLKNEGSSGVTTPENPSRDILGPKLIYLLLESSTTWSEVKARLHLRCERREEPHNVPEQPGKSFVFKGEASKNCWQWYGLLYAGPKLATKAVVRCSEGLVVLLPDQIPHREPAPFDESGIPRTDPKEMVRRVEEALKENPSSEWLRKFLDIHPPNEPSRDDFKRRDTKIPKKLLSFVTSGGRMALPVIIYNSCKSCSDRYNWHAPGFL